MENLDLYAKIEPLIGFGEAYEGLYARYLGALFKLDVKTVLDVGCGSGAMLVHLQKRYEAEGIDISPEMVSRAMSRGVKASCTALCDVTKHYDAIVAVADVLNYLDQKRLKDFLRDIERSLVSGGYFICDINTLFGFEEVTAGSMSVDNGDQFLSIEADFENPILHTRITLFEKENGCYQKTQAEILQYYHTLKEITSKTRMKLLQKESIALFGEAADKNILIFKKEA